MPGLHFNLATAVGVVVRPRQRTRSMSCSHRRSPRAGDFRRRAGAAFVSSYAVINYTENWIYVCFAAAGSWVGAFFSLTFLRAIPSRPPAGASPE